ncbi:MAG: 2-phosphosulfolactate phosphatase [Bacteroidia bacterium]|nr:2-phosphosulfolactate phosphatase [Bacteroidia bacterium]
MNRSSKPLIDVCISPALYPQFSPQDSIVVVIDILRATSSICVAFANGASSLVPVATIEDSMAYKTKGFLIGAERQGAMLDGFDFGNSPFSYMDARIKNSNIALTTTNGTKALNIAKNAHTVVVGSFLNIDVLSQWLVKQNRNVICLCAGWKNSMNLEDTLFAGALVDALQNDFDFSDFRDSAIAAQQLYSLAKNDLYGYLDNSSHRKRLERLHIEDDIHYCLQLNKAPVVPVLRGHTLYAL